MASSPKNKVIAKNKKAFFDFEIIEKFEAGIILKGYEVKSIRLGNVNLKGAYVVLGSNTAEIVGMHVSQYVNADVSDYKPDARRSLLLNAKELDRLRKAENDSSLTIAPLDIYLKKGLIKLTIAIARGKKKHDKRESIKRKDLDREIGRSLKYFK